MSDEQNINLTAVITAELHGSRLDQALAQLLPQYSRAQIQTWIKNGSVTIDAVPCDKVRQKVLNEQSIAINTTLSTQIHWQAQNLPINIVFEDDSLLVVNKAVGMITHPGAGNPDNTLVNALLHHHPDLSLVPRAGLIHRLDKNTSGLLVIAKTLESHHILTQAMKAREIKREYLALAKGEIISGASIDAPIARHSVQRTKMAVTPNGRKAITHYRVKERFRGYTLLWVELETGRTHQIRVHLSYIDHPIVGDPTYGRRIALKGKFSDKIKRAIAQFEHQALHAAQLSLTHPILGDTLQFSAPLPNDFQQLLHILRDGQSHD